MGNKKIYGMLFSKVYKLLIAKAEKKSRTKEEVYKITTWLTGYTNEQIDELINSDIKYGEFFLQAPNMNPKRKSITGIICGVKVEDIEDQLMQEIRYLDKMIDELTKEKPIDKILRD